ncbi:TerB family tellurite resistance protein [Ideonella sp. DXS22W]|uniref:TerB family tellurite resistance protein n=1 Tax=Pseudaquabacterium inlustre TaxID=2984192 RepID=A0ABU9CHQ8_9BURK
MRSLPRNSPEAAGRLLALVVMADGHVCRSELEGLQAQQAERRLGLAPGALAQLLHQLCDDLLAAAPSAAGLAQALDDDTVLALLDEVDDPALQRQVFELAMAATRADGHAAEGELSLLGSMIVRWGLFDAGEVQPVTQALARSGGAAVLQAAA